MKDFLYLHTRDLPYFRALLRAVESRFYQDIHLPAPILDLGCGDGHFAQLTFDGNIDIGLDPWTGPIREAKGRKVYNLLVQADAGGMPFPDRFFSSAISNSVLEHIPHIDAVLAETARVMKPGAPLIFCVPNHLFNSSLSVSRVFKKWGFQSLAHKYEKLFDRISRHIHLDSSDVWSERLEKVGFVVEKHWNYFSLKSLAALEWGHIGGLPSLFTRRTLGKWILVPRHWNLFLTLRLLRPLYEEDPILKEGAYTFYITRRNI